MESSEEEISLLSEAIPGFSNARLKQKIEERKQDVVNKLFGKEIKLYIQYNFRFDQILLSISNYAKHEETHGSPDNRFTWAFMSEQLKTLALHPFPGWSDFEPDPDSEELTREFDIAEQQALDSILFEQIELYTNRCHFSNILQAVAFYAKEKKTIVLWNINTTGCLWSQGYPS